ncbi:MAG: DUF3347 domain-containing protein [Bacteroidetes bacterium]|nr:DUF3347 domain-containing protein [Bacteroidota bacterium]
MKKILFSVALLATVFVQQSFAQETSKAQPSPLLTSYYNLKDALVSSNATAAAASSEAFIKALNEMDKAILKDESRNALLADANAISQSKDLKLQREKFATLSTNMFVLAKAVKLSADPVYQQYCPMKKASWLSDNKAIKNPYYGNAMLTCGSVKETL